MSEIDKTIAAIEENFKELTGGEPEMSIVDCGVVFLAAMALPGIGVNFNLKLEKGIYNAADVDEILYMLFRVMASYYRRTKGEIHEN